MQPENGNVTAWDVSLNKCTGTERHLFPMAGAAGFRLCLGRFLPKSVTEKLRLAPLPHFACSSSVACGTEPIDEREHGRRTQN